MIPPLFDYEVRVTYPDKRTELVTIGHAANPPAACKRALSFGRPEGTTAAVVRVIQAHAPASTPLADLTERWDPLEAGGRRFVLIDRQGRVAASEYEGGHMLTAWQFLTGYQPAAAWKTAATLVALRQAIREEHAACRSEYLDELFDSKPTLNIVRAWMREARARDVDHHGSNTF